MSTTFYYAPMSSAIIAHWAIEELGLKVEKVKVDLAKKEQKDPKYLALNPNGKVPLLVVDGTPIFETIAILSYLGETYGVEKGLYPSTPLKRAEAMKWMAWSGVSIGAALARFANASNERFPKEQHNAATAAAAKAEAEDLLAILDHALAGKQYLVDNTFSLADMMLAGQAAYLGMFGFDLSKHTNIVAWRDRCTARPICGQLMAASLTAGLRNIARQRGMVGDSPTCRACPGRSLACQRSWWLSRRAVNPRKRKRKYLRRRPQQWSAVARVVEPLSPQVPPAPCSALPLHVLIGGDLIPHRPSLASPAAITAALAPLADTFRGADAVVANYEAATGELEKKAFRLAYAAPPEWLAALPNAGIGAVSVANNHACDLDYEGVEATLAAASENGVTALGGDAKGDPWQPRVTSRSGTGKKVCADRVDNARQRRRRLREVRAPRRRAGERGRSPPSCRGGETPPARPATRRWRSSTAASNTQRRLRR